ncbi:MAG: hypothetical protein HOP21_12395 [Methylotenera sp.]|nr:hypothetical protein [Methylotenera sp.]
MNTWVKHGLSIGFSVLLTSCVIGNGRICGPQTPVAYCDKEALDRLLHPKSPVDYWDKEGMANEVRLQDWIECGGRFDGNYTPSKRLPEEKDDFAASRRALYSIQRCMLKKGYHYIGKCDNEIRKATPACGAP